MQKSATIQKNFYVHCLNLLLEMGEVEIANLLTTMQYDNELTTRQVLFDVHFVNGTIETQLRIVFTKLTSHIAEHIAE